MGGALLSCPFCFSPCLEEALPTLHEGLNQDQPCKTKTHAQQSESSYDAVVRSPLRGAIAQASLL